MIVPDLGVINWDAREQARQKAHRQDLKQRVDARPKLAKPPAPETGLRRRTQRLPASEPTKPTPRPVTIEPGAVVLSRREWQAMKKMLATHPATREI